MFVTPLASSCPVTLKPENRELLAIVTLPVSDGGGVPGENGSCSAPYCVRSELGEPVAEDCRPRHEDDVLVERSPLRRVDDARPGVDVGASGGRRAVQGSRTFRSPPPLTTCRKLQARPVVGSRAMS